MEKFIKQFYLNHSGIIFLNFHAPSRSKVLMVHLKLIFLLLLAITIFSCYSAEPDCLYCVDIIWEPTSNLSGSSLNLHKSDSWHITVASDGNGWTYYLSYKELS